MLRLIVMLLIVNICWQLFDRGGGGGGGGVSLLYTREWELVCNFWARALDYSVELKLTTVQKFKKQ